MQLGDVADPGFVRSLRIELAIQQIEMAEAAPGCRRRHTGRRGSLVCLPFPQEGKNLPLADGDALGQQLLPDFLGGDPLAGAQVEFFHQRAQHLVPLLVLGFGGATLGAVVEVGFADAEKPAGQVGTIDGNPAASGLKAGELRQSLLHDGAHSLQLCGGLSVLLPQRMELFLQPQQVLVVGTGQLGVESAEPCAQGLVGDAGFILQLRQCPAPPMPDVELPLIRSFETRVISEATMEDLDWKLIEEYRQIVGASETTTPLDLLRARGVIKGPAEDPQITVAAIVLFAKIPTQFLPSARVRFLRYEGNEVHPGIDFNVVKDVTLEQPLHRILVDGKQLLANQMREFQQLTKEGVFKRIPEYPEFAWLEALVNAVTHRDYSISGDYIRISMFDDRIEFLSPGKLPSIVTVDNIQHTRFSRNPLIARVLSDFGWVRELNEGVKRIYTDMESFFLEPPVFSEPNGNTVSLVLKNNIAMRSVRKMENLKAISPKEWMKLEPLDQEIVYCIANSGKCTTRMLEKFTNKSRATLVKHLKKLSVENGGPVEEHSSSPQDPTKYFTVK